jgi:hypothetical protein
MLCLQLQNSKDVVAQAQSVAGLAAQLGAGSFTGRSREQGRVDDYIITILSQVMRDDSYFCRCDRCDTSNLGYGHICCTCDGRGEAQEGTSTWG